MSRHRWTVFVSWLAAVSSVVGQTSNVTECIPSYEWALNSLGQTPCLVAAFLEFACGVAAAVDAIPVGNHYLGPTPSTATPCECSSVTYSLLSACGGCQNRTFIDWLTWSENCATPSFMTFPKPIPTTVVVPSWAYLNLTQTDNTFNALAAEQNFTATASSTSIPTSASTSSASSASAGNSKSNAGAIAGAVVGGLVFLAIIGLVVLWYILRRKRNMVQKDVAFDSQALVSGPSLSQTTPGPSLPSQSIYTSDMSTFAGSPLTTSGVFTTIPPSRRSLESLSLSVAQLGGGPQNHGTVPAQHGYRGMPEI